MANSRILTFLEKLVPEDSNWLIIQDASKTKRITFANLIKPIRDMIGNLAGLNTTHKATLVGAVNELQANNSLLVVTDKFTAGAGVNSLTALKIGRLVFVRFNVQPTTTAIQLFTTEDFPVKEILGRNIEYAPGTNSSVGLNVYKSNSNKSISMTAVSAYGGLSSISVTYVTE